MKLLISIHRTILALSLLTLMGSGTAYAQKADDISIKLYVLDSCPHCQALLKEIEPLGIIEQLSVTQIEVTSEAEQVLLLADLLLCGDDDRIVPTLVIGEKCYQGRSDVTEVLYQQAGLTQQGITETDPPENTETSDSTEIVMTETAEEPEQERLSDRLEGQTEETRKLPEITLMQFIIIVLSIGAFIYLARTMIKKLKL